MNFKLVFNITGRVMMLLALTMVPSLLVALIYGEPVSPFLYTMIILLAAGFLLSRLRYKKTMFIRDGFFTVGLIWLLMGLFGALPYYLCGSEQFASYVDCVFECISGFTTTGSTILNDVEILPRGVLFWRASTHWLGGMGVLVLTTALLPSMGIRSQFLIQAESPGPVFSKLTPKQSHTSKILYGIYCGLTVLAFLALKLAGMNWYDSIFHALSCAGTGGFSSYNDSIAHFQSSAIEMIIAVFVVLFSVNFAAYFLLLTGRVREILKSDELRFFLLVVAGATVLISVNIFPVYQSVWQCFRYAFFQVTTIVSTTGMSTANYMDWPVFSQVILILLLVCGACAGSTGGGMKCSRVLLGLKSIVREIRQIIHPRSVSVIKLDGKVVPENTMNSLSIYIVGYFLIAFLTTLVVSLDNFSFATGFTAALTCMSNVGPGLDAIGPDKNFAAFSDLSKVVLSTCMVVGRLEIFPILVLFSRRAWRHT